MQSLWEVQEGLLVMEVEGKKCNKILVQALFILDTLVLKFSFSYKLLVSGARELISLSTAEYLYRCF